MVSDDNQNLDDQIDDLTPSDDLVIGEDFDPAQVAELDEDVDVDLYLEDEDDDFVIDEDNEFSYGIDAVEEDELGGFSVSDDDFSPTGDDY